MKRGFTLIELSIVLIIIGLLIGGVMIGKSLVTAATNQAIISDFQKYQVAANNYNKKYRAWPGDDDEAETRWGTNPVYNGDGNGQFPSPTGAMPNDREYYQFWLHLLKADLITGTYTGLAGSVPVAPISGWNITHYYDASYPARQTFFFTLMTQPNQTYTTLYELKEKTVKAIDNKMDDGIITTGNLQGYDCGHVPGYLGGDTTAYCTAMSYIYKNQ